MKSSHFAAGVLCALFLSLVPRSGLAISFYDFEDLNPGTLIGQDGWTNDLSSIGNGVVGFVGGINGTEGLRCTNTTGTTYFRRFSSDFYVFQVYSNKMTNAIWQFDAQYTNVLDNGIYLSPRGTNQIGINFGINKSNLWLRGAAFGTNISQRPIPAAFTNGDWIRLRVVADFTASTNEGRGVLFYRNLTDGETDFTAWITNNNLEIMSKAFTNGAGLPNVWTGLQVQCDGTTFRADNLLVGDADLGVGAEAAPVPFYLTDQNIMTYTISVTNYGPLDTTNAVLLDVIPTNSALVSVTPSQGTWTQNQQFVICSLGSLVKDATAQITIVVTNIVNSRLVNISVSGATMGDGNPVNNGLAITTIVYNSFLDLDDLAAYKTVTPEPVISGTGVLSYVLSVTNKGPATSVGTLIEDTLPTGVTFLPPTPTLHMRMNFTFATNELITTADTSGNQHTGTLVNAIISSNGFNSAGAIFDGDDDRVEVADTLDLRADRLEYLSLSARVKLQAVATQSTILVKSGTMGASNANYGLRLEGRQIAFYYRGSLGTHVYKSTANLVTNGQWSQVAVTYRFGHASTIKMYHNGAEVAAAWTTLNGLEQPIVTNEPLWLGAVRSNGTNVTEELNGILDDVRLYRRYLASNEVVLLSDTNYPRSDEGWIDLGNGNYQYDAGVIGSGLATQSTLRARVLSSSLGVLTNTMICTNVQIEINGGDNLASCTSTVTPFVDLFSFGAVSLNPASAGTNYFYTVVVSNAGPSDAQNVVLSNAIPPEVIFVASNSTEGSYFTNGIVTYSLGTRTAYSVTSVVIMVFIPSAANAGELTNFVSFSSDTPELDDNNNGGPITNQVNQKADLRISQTNVPNPVIAGATLNFIVTVTNAGPSDAQDVLASDNVPPEVIPFDQVFSNLGYIVSHTYYTFTVTVQAAASAFGAITNKVLVVSPTTDPLPANNSNVQATAITRQSDLAIRKSDSVDPVLAGAGSLVYTILVTNNGPSDATSIIVTDNLPNVLSPSGTYTTNFAILPAAAWTSFTLSASVDSAAQGAITNRATVINANTDPQTNNNTVFETTAIALQSDLSATKTASPGGVVPGTGVVTYTLSFSNGGPSDAQGVLAVDTMPSGLVYLSQIPTSALTLYYAFSNPAETQRVTDLSGNSYTGIVFANTTFTTNSIFPGGMVFDGDADRIQVQSIFSAGPSILNGGSYTFSAWIQPSSLPTNGTIYNKGQSRQNFSPLTANYNVRTRNAGIEFYYQDSIGTNDQIYRTTSTNILSIGTWTHVALTHQMGTNASTKFYINGVESPGSWVVGSGNTPCIVSSNAPMIGAEAAAGGTNVINEFFGTLDELRLYTRILSSSEVYRLSISSLIENDIRCVESNGTVTCTIGGIPRGNTTSLVIRALVPQNITSALSNTVHVTSDTLDNNSANDTGFVVHSPSGQVDLVVYKSADSASVLSGQQRLYTVSVTNKGPTFASNVSIVDTLPPLTTFVATNSTGGAIVSSNTVTYNVGNLATNTGATVVIGVLVSSGNTASNLTNNAVVSCDVSELNAANNATNQVITAGRFVTMQVRMYDAPDPVGATNIVTYTIVVSNTGPSDAQAVYLTNRLPAYATFNTNGSTSFLSLNASGLVVGSWGQMVAGTYSSVIIKATANLCSTGLGTNAVAIATDTGFGGSASDTTRFDFLAPSLGLYDFETITLGATLGPTDNWVGVTGNGIVANTAGIVSRALRAQSGTNVFVFVVRTNDLRFAFPTFRTNTTDGIWQMDVQDNRTGLVYFAMVGSNELPEIALMGINSNGFFTSLGSAARPVGVDPGDIVRLRYTINFAANSGNGAATLSYLNRTDAETNFTQIISDTNLFLGSYTSYTNWTVAALNLSSSSLVDNVTVSLADLGISKSDSVDPVICGSNVIYTIIVSNNGPMKARDVVVVERMPDSSTFSSATPEGQSVLDGSCLVRQYLGDLASGATTTTTVSLALTIAATNTNTVVVQSGYFDPDQTNNTARITTTGLPGADMSVTKVDSSDPAAAGSSFTYTVFVTNRGPHTATNVIVTDTLPTNGSPNGLIVTNFGIMAAGSRTSFSVSVSTLSSFLGALTNKAAITATTLDPDQSNNIATELTTIIGSANLSIQKTDSVDPVIAGTSLVYTIVVTNAGPSDALSCTVTDSLPAGVAPSGTLASNLGTLVVGASRTFSVTVSVNTVTLGAITNLARIWSSTGDPATNNNATSQVTVVNAFADLLITKTDSPDPVTSNNLVTYTIVVTNPGPSAAQNVQIVDVLPVQVTFQSATAGGSPDTGKVYFLPLALDRAQSTTVVVQVTVNGGTVGVITNTANVTTDTTDTNSANNTATALTTIADFDGDGSPDFGDTDDDNDGIPDFWELLYGLNLTNAADATNDSDSDGFSNLREWLADTVPTNSGSYHHITVVSNRPIRFVIFPSSTGRVYGLEYTTSMTQQGWVPVETNIQGQAGTTSLGVTNDTSPVYYRVGVGFP